MIQLQPPHRRFPKSVPRGTPILSIGVDPDLHSTAVVGVYGRLGEPAVTLGELSICSTDKKLKGEEATIEMCRRLAIEPCYLATMHLMKDQGLAPEAIVFTVEGQEVWQGSTGRPADILRIARVAGAALADPPTGHVGLLCQTYCPDPPDWKGTIDTHKVQARTWRDLGVPLTDMELAGGQEPYVVPRTLAAQYGQFKKTDWKHLGDAAGLALWGLRVCWAP